MPKSRALTVHDYLSALPKERRDVVSTVRKVIRKHLPKGYRETMSWGYICYEIPLKMYSATYNGQPLCYAGLAAQKNHFALYLMGAYGDPTQRKVLEDAFAKSGKRLDMGKSCLRFRSVDDLPLDAIGRVVASMPPAKYVAQYEAARKK